jgi:hypothetical protein
MREIKNKEKERNPKPVSAARQIADRAVQQGITDMSWIAQINGKPFASLDPVSSTYRER